MRGRMSSPARYFRQVNSGGGRQTGFGECVDQTPPQDKPPSGVGGKKTEGCRQIGGQEFRRELDAVMSSRLPVELQQIQLQDTAGKVVCTISPDSRCRQDRASNSLGRQDKGGSRPAECGLELRETLVATPPARDFEAGPSLSLAEHDAPDFSSESIALSGDDRVAAIRAVLLVFCAQVLVCCASAGILLCNGQEFLPSAPVRIFALCGLVVTAYAAYQSYCVLNSCKWLSMINFGVFSGCLSVNLASLGMLLPSGMMNHWMAQFCAAVLGLTIYAWMTRYEEWSSKEETIFNLVPVVFASAVMLFFLCNNYFSIIGTGALSVGICRLLQDCSKDSFSCLERLDLLCGEVIGLYSSCLGRLHFIVTRKFQKNFLHKSTVI